MIWWGRNQKGEIYFLFNFGCLKCRVMFGDIEYNYYFFDDAKGEKDMTFFECIGELSYLAIKCAYILIA
jgi:hypothetical protein